MLSRLVITFLPRSKRLLISWLQSQSAVILKPPKIKWVTVSTVYQSICHEVTGPDAMIFTFWMLSQLFNSPLSLSSNGSCGKFLKRWKYQTTFTCLLRNLYGGQEATVRTRHGTTDWFQSGKGVCQSCILSPCLFNLYAEHVMQNARIKQESRFLGEISIISDTQMTPPLWQKAKN